MKKAIGRFLLSLSGWKVNTTVPPEAQRCVMIAAPHTTNWDAYYLLLAFMALGIPLRFTIKDDWTRFPFGLFIKPLGGIGINRKPKKEGEKRRSQVEVMTEVVKERDRIAMVVAIEGTRAPNSTWKQGFYHIAMNAGVPITFGYLDYKKKEAGVGPALHPSGDFHADMKIITDFYRNISPKYPENYHLDERFK